MRMSATMIGKVLGKPTKEVYSLLKDQGFLDGEQGNWSLTELGKKIGGEVRQKDNGEGGFCKRSWPVLSWDEKIVNILKKK
ncbi:hypothetical protein [Peribacillus butanolivorans]|uniref:hypothetical protein n=1 Tax=Peribacillus butanolivorans TaxID=421767 RepID=UPI003662B83C